MPSVPYQMLNGLLSRLQRATQTTLSIFFIKPLFIQEKAN